MKKTLLSVTLVLMFVLAACSPAVPTAAPPTAVPTTPPPTVAPTAASASIPAFPTGKFTLAGSPNRALQFNANGTFAALDGTAQLASGTYTVKDGVFTEESNDAGCVTSMHYRYSFDGGKLKFYPVEDPAKDACDGRKADFGETSTWELATQGASAPEIKILATDFSYSTPETTEAGWVHVSLTNAGAEPHHVQFMRLNDGVTASQFEAALKQGEGPAMALVKLLGGVGAVRPGGSASAWLNLPAGDYVILCFIPSPSDNVAHHAKGMIKTLTVKAGKETAAEPKADLSVRMTDFTYTLPDSLPAGRLTLQVTNDGPEPHELNLLRLAEGKALEDAVQFLKGAGGPPPFAPVGGMNGLDVGAMGYAEVDLEPGTYLAICNIPSPKNAGHPHFTLGMIKAFTVK